MTHPRAKLTVQGRQLLVERVLEDGWTVPMAAEAQGCSAATGYKWIRRFAAEGVEGLRDRSSRPHRSPARLSQEREQAIVSRRHTTLEGPHRIAWALGGYADARLPDGGGCTPDFFAPFYGAPNDPV